MEKICCLESTRKEKSNIRLRARLRRRSRTAKCTGRQIPSQSANSVLNCSTPQWGWFAGLYFHETRLVSHCHSLVKTSEDRSWFNDATRLPHNLYRDIERIFRRGLCVIFLSAMFGIEDALALLFEPSTRNWQHGIQKSDAEFWMFSLGKFMVRPSP